MNTRALPIIHRHLSSVAAGKSPDIVTQANFQCPNGINIFTKAWGKPSSGRKVIALHGYLDNTGSFDLLGPALAQQGFEIVAMDFPGHGKSDAMSKDAWYSILEYPEYVIEVARSKGWDRYSLVGHSLGGAVALMVASTFPEQIERCAFIDVLGPFAVSPGSSPRHLRRSIESRRVLLTKEPKPYASPDDAIRQRLKSVRRWGVGQTMSWKGAARLVAGGSEYHAGGHIKFTNDGRLRAYSPSYLTEDAVMAYVKAVECPCLVVRGERGMVTENAAFRARKAALGERLGDLVLPGSHHLHLDDDTAPLVAECVGTFLQDGRHVNPQLRSAL